MEEDDFAPAHRRKKLPVGDPGASLLKPPLCPFVDFPAKYTKLRRCQPAQLSSAHPPLSSPIRGYMFFETALAQALAEDA